MAVSPRRVEALVAPVAVVVVVGVLAATWALRATDDEPDEGPAAAAPTTSSSAPADASPSATASTGDGPRAARAERPRLPDPIEPLASDLPEPSCSAPVPPTRMDVVTLNTAAPPTRSGYDVEALLDELRSYDADVLLLQGIQRRRDGVDVPRALARSLGTELAWAVSVVEEREGRRPRETGVAVLSRYPIAERGDAALPSREGLEPRRVLGVRLEVDGAPVEVYTTLLEEESGAVRDRQAEAVATVVGARELPTLVGGDLGAGPATAAVRSLTDADLTDAWSAVAGTDPGATVPASAPRSRHDYLLADGAWQPVAAELLRSRVASHLALRVTYDVATVPDCLPPGSVS